MANAFENEYKMLTPDEMVKFLNKHAAQCHGYELKNNLFQCAVYIQTINQALESIQRVKEN